jgi:hypothetical protein
MRAVWIARFALVELAVPLACACGGQLPHPEYVAQPTSALVEVTRPPPPARVETVPPSPAASAVWIDGEWTWRRARWAWLPGRWVNATTGARFSPWVFVRGRDGRLWVAPGVWRDANGKPVDPPEALAEATVEGGAVVTADGNIEVTGPTLRASHARSAPTP